MRWLVWIPLMTRCAVVRDRLGQQATGLLQHQVQGALEHVRVIGLEQLDMPAALRQ